MADFLDTFKRHESSSEESGAEDEYEGDFAKGIKFFFSPVP